MMLRTSAASFGTIPNSGSIGASSPAGLRKRPKESNPVERLQGSSPAVQMKKERRTPAAVYGPSPEKSGRHHQQNAEQSLQFAGVRSNRYEAAKIAAQENPQRASRARPAVHQSLARIEQQRPQAERRELHEERRTLSGLPAEAEKECQRGNQQDPPADPEQTDQDPNTEADRDGDQCQKSLRVGSPGADERDFEGPRRKRRNRPTRSRSNS